jgi:hypothetical protein
MRMFQLYLKTFKEENNIEDREDSEDSEEEERKTIPSSSDSTGYLFGHDPVCTQDALDAISGIEDIPELNY